MGMDTPNDNTEEVKREFLNSQSIFNSYGEFIEYVRTHWLKTSVHCKMLESRCEHGGWSDEKYN